MNNKERFSEGGNGINGWEGLGEKVRFSGGESIETRRDNRVEKTGEGRRAESDKTPGLKKRGELNPTERQPSAKNVLREIMNSDPEWKEPEVKVFLAGREGDIDREEMIVYPISAEKRAAVPREKATWSFMNQVNKAKTLDDFRAANLLAQAIEADQSTEPEAIEQIKEFRQNPAYLIKKAGFQVEATERGLIRDKDALKLAEAQYDESRAGGFFKRLFNRHDIKQKKERMEWTKQRVVDGKAQLAKDRATLAKFMPNRKTA